MVHVLHRMLVAAVAGGAFCLSSGVALAAVDPAVMAVQTGNMAQARSIFASRSLPGHFSSMNADKRGGVSYPEMDQYFMAMHIAFDVNRDGIVSVQEAPQILLKYRLSGRPFPPQGLTQAELRARLQELFVKVDYNRDGELSWLEMLR